MSGPAVLVYQNSGQSASLENHSSFRSLPPTHPLHQHQQQQHHLHQQQQQQYFLNNPQGPPQGPQPPPHQLQQTVPIPPAGVDIPQIRPGDSSTLPANPHRRYHIHQRPSASMGDFYAPKRKDVVDKLRRRIDLYRSHQESTAVRYNTAQQNLYEQSKQDTNILRNRWLESKAKKAAKQAKASRDSTSLQNDHRNLVVSVSTFYTFTNYDLQFF